MLCVLILSLTSCGILVVYCLCTGFLSCAAAVYYFLSLIRHYFYTNHLAILRMNTILSLYGAVVLILA